MSIAPWAWERGSRHRPFAAGTARERPCPGGFIPQPATLAARVGVPLRGSLPAPAAASG